MSESISRDEWLKALGEAARPCDPGAMTVSEISAEFGIGREAAYRKVKKLIAEGKAVTTCKMVTTSEGYPKRVVAYKLIAAPTKAARR